MLIWVIIVDVDFVHLAEVMFIRFLHDAVTLFIPLYILYSLEGSHYAELTLRRWAVCCLPPVLLRMEYLKKKYLEFFCTENFSLCPIFFFFCIICLCQWVNIDSWILILYVGYNSILGQFFVAWCIPALAIGRSMSWLLCLFGTHLLLVVFPLSLSPSILSLLAFQFVKFQLTCIQAHWSLLFPVYWHSLLKRSFQSCHNVFDFQHSLFFFIRVPVSLLILSSVLICCLPFLSKFLTY